MNKSNLLLTNQTERWVTNVFRRAGCLFSEEETLLLISEAETLEDLKNMIKMRAEGLPLEYIIGYTQFCGQRIEINKGVFVPRRRTEFLVRQAERLACAGDIVIDLCCGSGAVGVALAAELAVTFKGITLYLVDNDPIAVKCAQRNLKDSEGHVMRGELYEALPDSLRGDVNLIVANPPHVPTKELQLLPREARLHEPKAAFDGGEDGLNLFRRVAKEARRWLAPGGHLLIETSPMQASEAYSILTGFGLTANITRDKELDVAVVIGTNPALKHHNDTVNRNSDKNFLSAPNEKQSLYHLRTRMLCRK